MNISKKFGHKIRRYRKKQGLTQSEFAVLCNVEPSYISKFELGKMSNPQFKTLEYFANCMGISVCDLIREEEPEELLSWEEQSDSRFLYY